MYNNILLDKIVFLIIDFETINPKGISPEPIELGVVKLKNKLIEESSSISWLIQPPKNLHLNKFDILQTGIKESDLKVTL